MAIIAFPYRPCQYAWQGSILNNKKTSRLLGKFLRTTRERELPLSLVATAVTAAISTLARAGFKRASLVYHEGATVEILSVPHGDSLFGIGITGHFDKAEAFRTTGGTVGNNAR